MVLTSKVAHAHIKVGNRCSELKSPKSKQFLGFETYAFWNQNKLSTTLVLSYRVYQNSDTHKQRSLSQNVVKGQIINQELILIKFTEKELANFS